MNVLALDIGGANLKAADGRGWARSTAFALWRRPTELAGAIAELIASAPSSDRVVATMTGELADCFATKAEGVAAILDAVESAAAGRRVDVFLVDGSFVAPEAARRRPLGAAASNWRALSEFAARLVDGRIGLLVDVGSTTTDIVPIVDGRPATVGTNDPERLAAGELVYVGVVRTPVCAVAAALPWRGAPCPVAAETFATMRDAYVTLGLLPEDAECRETADGRPATRPLARDRLARSICADRSMYGNDDAHAGAAALARALTARVGVGLNQTLRRLPAPPTVAVVSGIGEFVARDALVRLRSPVEIVSLAERIGTDASLCAPAHALATLALERAGSLSGGRE